MSKKSRDAIEAQHRRIQPCERRLALSASLTTELLLEALQLETESTTDTPLAPRSDSPENTQHSSSSSPDGGPTPNLMEQAAQIRHASGLDGRGQTVAVIDSGIAWDHVALGGGYGPGYRVVGGWDFAESDANPYDDGPAGYHGSHVAGLLAGQSDQFSGIAPGADLVALRVFDDQGAGQLQWIESALQWVHEHQNEFDSPITTVNLSVGALLSDSNRADAMAMIEDELQLLRSSDILVFAAAGNLFDPSDGENLAGNSQLMYPASSAAVEAVTSIDSEGALSQFSQRIPGIFATQGESITSSVPDHVFGWDGHVDDLATLDGTSMATPQIAAASMLVRQSMIDQGLDPSADDVLAQLRQASPQRIDDVKAEPYYLIDLQSAIVDAVESVSRVDGTNESQRVILDLSDGIRVTVGDAQYSLDPAHDGPLVIDVAGGADWLTIIGSDRAERLILDPAIDATSRLSTNNFEIELRGFEEVDFRGGGGRDRATLYDSPGDDTLRSHPGSATMSGVGFRFQVNDVPRIYSHASGGGSDTAFLHDSGGDDSLSVRPQFTSLRNDSSFQLANGFQRVFAYATAGGFDSAEIGDSAGDDTLSISSSRSIITGPDYQVSARGFQSILAYANGGGDDVARIYGDGGSNQWHSTDNMVQWTGNDSGVRVARGFERTLAFESFEPIELTPQSHALPSPAWWMDDPAKRARIEADAIRSVFETLGRDGTT